MMTVKKLNRYTSLPVLLDMLERKKLVLLNPNTWEDKNDVEIIMEYKKRKKATNLFALCFSCGAETIHHWKSFSNGASGCCIEFDGPKLLSIFNRNPKIRHGKVKYRTLKDVESGYISIDQIPFTKRWPYRCEEEYRVLWEGKTYKKYIEIKVPLTVIRRITISQQMPEHVYETIKAYLRRIYKNPDGRVNRSTVYENNRWISRFKDTR